MGNTDLLSTKKRVWVVAESEQIPQLTGHGRLMRGGQFAEMLSEMNCEVIWWTSNWLHYEDRFYSEQQETIEINKHLKAVLLHAGHAYKKHISIARILYCWNMGRQFKLNIEKMDKPQLIICSWPLIELGYEAVKYGKQNNIPVVIDIRDMWPEIFIQPFSGIMRLFAKVGIQLFYGRKTRYAMKNATQVIGIVDYAVDLAYRWGRPHNSKDRTVYLSKFKPKFSFDEEKMEAFWKEKNVERSDFLIIYVGSIDYRTVKLKMLANAAKRFKSTNVKFVFCGMGPSYNDFVKENCENPNVIIAGYRNKNELDYLGKIAKIGLIPYENTEDFTDSFPNKLSEYLSTSLIVFTTLSGKMRTLLESQECGEFFEDEETLCYKTLKYLHNPELVKKAQHNANQLFRGKFDAGVVYRSICKELINE